MTETARAIRPWLTAKKTASPAQAPAIPPPVRPATSWAKAVAAANIATLNSCFRRGWCRRDWATATPAPTASTDQAPVASTSAAPRTPSVSENVQR